MSDTAKERIIEASGPIFAQKGFSATTVREICSEAKVNQAAINYYFGSKENLYKEVFTSTYSSMTPWFEDVNDADRDHSQSFEDRLLQTMIRRTKEFFATELSRWKIQLMFREIHDPSPSCGEKLQEYIARDYRNLYTFLDEFFDPATPPDIRWKFILALMGTIVHCRSSYWLVRKVLPDGNPENSFRPEQIAEFAVKAFLAGAAAYRRS